MSHVHKQRQLVFSKAMLISRLKFKQIMIRHDLCTSYFIAVITYSLDQCNALFLLEFFQVSQDSRVLFVTYTIIHGTKCSEMYFCACTPLKKHILKNISEKSKRKGCEFMKKCALEEKKDAIMCIKT